MSWTLIWLLVSASGQVQQYPLTVYASRAVCDDAGISFTTGPFSHGGKYACSPRGVYVRSAVVVRTKG